MMKVRILTGLFMGTFMSLIMSGFITAVNTGIDEGYMARWLLAAFPVAWILAVPLAIFAGPHARKIAERFAK